MWKYILLLCRGPKIFILPKIWILDIWTHIYLGIFIYLLKEFCELILQNNFNAVYVIVTAYLFGLQIYIYKDNIHKPSHYRIESSLLLGDTLLKKKISENEMRKVHIQN